MVRVSFFPSVLVITQYFPKKLVITHYSCQQVGTIWAQSIYTKRIYAISRRKGLKIPRWLSNVPVRVRPSALFLPLTPLNWVNYRNQDKLNENKRKQKVLVCFVMFWALNGTERIRPPFWRSWYCHENSHFFIKFAFLFRICNDKYNAT